MQNNDSGEWESKHVELDAKMLTCYATLTLMSMKEDGQGVLLSKLKAVRVLEAVSDGAGPEVFPFQVIIAHQHCISSSAYHANVQPADGAWCCVGGCEAHVDTV